MENRKIKDKIKYFEETDGTVMKSPFPKGIIDEMKQKFSRQRKFSPCRDNNKKSNSPSVFHKRNEREQSISNQKDDWTPIKNQKEESNSGTEKDDDGIYNTQQEDELHVVDRPKQEDQGDIDSTPSPTSSTFSNEQEKSNEREQSISNQKDDWTHIKNQKEESNSDTEKDDDGIYNTQQEDEIHVVDRPKQEDQGDIDSLPSPTSPTFSNEQEDDCLVEDNDVRETSYRFVCAIDLGTSHSGYAYSSKEQFESNPGNVVSKVWGNGKLLSKKAPTSILYSPDGSFHSFGYEAEEDYKNLLIEDEVSNWRMFKHFKMKLYNQMNTETLMIEDQNGKGKLAIEVFSDALRYLRNDLLVELKKKAAVVSNDDCRWVLTVPAIWNNDARQFMIKAAEQAGIKSDTLMLCLEPEAAAILCLEERSNNYFRLIGDQNTGLDIGSKLVVVDLGGGTVDITCNEKMSNGSMKEIKSATGGDCGGTSVDREFLRFLAGMLDKTTIEQVKKHNQYEMAELQEEFEKTKREFDSDKNKSFFLKLPYELKEKMSLEKMNKLYNNGVDIIKDKMKISKDIMKTFFKPSAEQVTDCLKRLVDEDSDIRSIILVGGFSGCSEVRRAIQESFPGKFIIDAVEPDLPVMRGAVIFGHNPSIICSRISKYWYGIGLIPELKPKDVCDGDFFPIISKGQSIKVGERISHRFEIDDTVTKDVIKVSQFYSANDKKPINSEDSNCKESGDALEVWLPKIQKKVKMILTISVQFHGTAFEYSTQVTTEMPTIRLTKQAF